MGQNRNEACLELDGRGVLRQHANNPAARDSSPTLPFGGNLFGITASMLYDYVQCPHRVSLDLFGDWAERDPVSAFVQLLWEKGHSFEREVIEQLDLRYVDMTGYSDEERGRGARCCSRLPI
jgi:hypothetical protein